MAVNLSDSSVYEATTTNFVNLDGIDYDNEGHFFVSSWGTNTVYRFDPTLDFAAVENAVINVGDPADIFYNRVTDTLAIPCTSGDSVVFRGFAPVVGVNEDRESNSKLEAVSLNGTLLLRWSELLGSEATLRVFAVDGRLLEDKVLSEQDLQSGTIQLEMNANSQLLLIEIASSTHRATAKLRWL